MTSTTEERDYVRILIAGGAAFVLLFGGLGVLTGFINGEIATKAWTAFEVLGSIALAGWLFKTNGVKK